MAEKEVADLRTHSATRRTNDSARHANNSARHAINLLRHSNKWLRHSPPTSSPPATTPSGSPTPHQLSRKLPRPRPAYLPPRLSRRSRLPPPRHAPRQQSRHLRRARPAQEAPPANDLRRGFKSTYNSIFSLGMLKDTTANESRPRTLDSIKHLRHFTRSRKGIMLRALDALPARTGPFSAPVPCFFHNKSRYLHRKTQSRHGAASPCRF